MMVTVQSKGTIHPAGKGKSKRVKGKKENKGEKDISDSINDKNIAMDMKSINNMAQENIQLWITHFQHNTSQLSEDLNGFIERYATDCKERDRKYFMSHHDSVLKLLMSSLVNEMTSILDQLLSKSTSQQKKAKTLYNTKLAEKNARINELEYYVKRLVSKCDSNQLKLANMKKKLKRGSQEYKKLKTKYEKLSEKALRLLNMELDNKTIARDPPYLTPIETTPSKMYYNHEKPIHDIVTAEQVKFNREKSMVEADKVRESIMETQKSLLEELEKKPTPAVVPKQSPFFKDSPIPFKESPLFTVSPRTELPDMDMSESGTITPITELSEGSEILQHQGMSKEEWDDYSRIRNEYSLMLEHPQHVRSYTPKRVLPPEFDDDVDSESSIVDEENHDMLLSSTKNELQVRIEKPTSPVEPSPDSITPDSATDPPIFHSTPQMTERSLEPRSVKTPSMDSLNFDKMVLTFERLSSANMPPTSDAAATVNPFPKPPTTKDFKASLKDQEDQISQTEALLHYSAMDDDE